MTHPYQDLPNYSFWRKSVGAIEHHNLDPVVNPKFKVDRFDRFSTAGSCFAQHISNRLASLGCNYFVPESGYHFLKEERIRRGYGVFSARYGNIYTVRQLLFLFQEAFGERLPSEEAWRRPDGRYVDPYRPNVDPGGFGSPEEVKASRDDHLNFVRATFLESDLLFFTLGLTESWISSASGDVFPLAPGVMAGNFQNGGYVLLNSDIHQVITDLFSFLDRIKSINIDIKVLLTVSPVPLIATAEQRHVLTATTYSKSVLRVAAEMAYKRYNWVDYFPSYEIITGNYTMGRYYESDFREVNSLGVDHAMRCFVRNYVEGATLRRSVISTEDNQSYARAMSAVICDEESIENTNI